MRSASPFLPEKVEYCIRLAAGLRSAIAHPSHPDPYATIRAQFENRASRFLHTLQSVVFHQTFETPLRWLFRQANCEYRDVEKAVQDRGLESALAELRRAGVYLTHEEFKGYTELVRNGKAMPANPASFHNPLATGKWETRSSGSSGTASQAPVSDAFRAYRDCQDHVLFQHLGARDRHWLSMAPILPATYGFSRLVSGHKMGLHARHWYAAGGRSTNFLQYRALTHLLCAEARWLGVPVPPLTFLGHNDYAPAARDLPAARRRGVPGLVTGGVSSAVRVAAAALDLGLDISGTIFSVGGEALSAAKADLIRRAGARAVSTYRVSEVGTVGYSCLEMAGSNTVHLFQDSIAAFAETRETEACGPVQSLFLTPLLATAPFFVINLEIGDHAEFGTSVCSCPFTDLGFTTTLDNIFSFTKITSHGTTLFGTDMVRILEQALPARCGGAPGDYQLAELEAVTGTRVVLRVNPRLASCSLDQVRECFLKEVRDLFGGSLTERMWRQAETVDVILEAPLVGRTGKILPIQTLGGQKKNAS